VFLDSDEESGYYIEEVIEGTSIASVLYMVQYDEKSTLRGALRNKSTWLPATNSSQTVRGYEAAGY